MRLPPCLALALALAVPCLLRAQGGPPFITDDPGTPERGHWELNVAWTQEHRPGETAHELPLFDLNYGFTDRIQLKYEVAHLVVHESGADADQAMGNSDFGVKWRFLDDPATGWSASIYPQLEFRTPGSGAPERGLASDETTLVLPVEVQHEAGGWGINAEVGLIRPSKSDSGWMYGVVVGHELNETVEAGIELHGESDASLRRSQLVANVGVRVKLHPRFVLLASVGRELHNHFEDRATLVSYLAIQFLR